MSSILKLKTFVRRKLPSFLKPRRPSSWPYISGDSFRCLAKFVYDESLDFNPSRVTKGDILFVRTAWLKEFFEKIDPSIKYPYVLISHNEDAPLTPEYAELLQKSGKLIHWFAENLTFSHKNISPLPIGLQNFYYRETGLPSDIRSIQEEKRQKDKTATWSFSIEGNGNREERNFIEQTASRLNWAKPIRTNQIDYFRAVAESKFVLSPSGSGEDCHRTWEALYFQTMPIVRRTPMTEYYASIGIPLLLLDSWQELEKLTKEQLDSFYTENVSKLNSPAIYMEYWAKEIQSKIDNYGSI